LLEAGFEQFQDAGLGPADEADLVSLGGVGSSQTAKVGSFVALEGN
jgi:hypothetical protein